MVYRYLNKNLNRFFAGIILAGAGVLGSPVYAATAADPSPVPAKVASRILHDLKMGQPDALPAVLRRHLDEAAALLQQTGESEPGMPTEAPLPAARHMQFAAKQHELKSVRDDVRARFAQTRAQLVTLGLGDKVKAWDQLLQQVEQRFARLDAALSGVAAGKNRAQRGPALAHAQAELHTLHTQVKDREDAFGNDPLPTFRSDTPTPVQPQPAAETLPQYLSYKEGTKSNRYAFMETGGEPGLEPGLDRFMFAAAPSVPIEAASCTYSAADLAATPDAPLSTEIRALAEKLGYSPARIYQYVVNEIKFEPYYGALKGATGTLYSKAGGPTDQASLLIALLRASNIPARYVKGSIQVNDATPLGKDGRGPRWLGAKSYAAAASILAQGRNPAAGSVTNGSGQVIGITLAHVWVEACIPYGNYRGTGVDNTGHRWIPFDPSFKDKTYQAGIAINVSFDYAGYLATRSNTLPQEKYAQQVDAAIKSVAPYFANNTLRDVGYTGKHTPRGIDILPATLPYIVSAFTAWPGSTSAEAAQLPTAHRYQFTITVKNAAGTTLAPALTLFLPEVALQRLTLSFKGATAADQTALDSWRSNPDMTAPLPCTVNVVPVLKTEGVDQATGSTAVGLCTTTNQLTLAITLPELSAPSINAVTYNNIGAANLHALQGYAFQASDRLLTERSAQLLGAVKATAAPNTNPDGIEGEFLHLAGLKYMRYLSDANRRVGELDGGSGESGNHLGLTATQMKVQYLFDLPFAVYRQGLLIDVPGGLLRNMDLTSGQAVWKTFLLSGYSGSAYESYIWQETARLDAVSTVRGLQFARETGIEVLTLTAANWAAESPKFTSNANAALNYAASQVASIKTAYIDQGYTLTIPRSLIQYQDWKGAVFVGEKNTIAVDGQASATYAINQYAGGYTTGALQPSAYNPVLDSSYLLSQVPPGAFTTLPATLTSAIGLGCLGYNSCSGDPVHLVTGNVYHTERDLAIKGRGLPLVFERSYNSRAAADGPLGYGWTHSFNHFLTFSDNNDNGLADAADSDGLTSSVTWTDGSGAQRFIKVVGTVGGVAVGNVFTAPSGFFFQTARQSDGTYTLREKNGLTYTFASQPGTVGQKAQLLKIQDRSGNALTLGYSGTLLGSVSDGLGRSLTFTYTGGRLSQVSDWTGRAHQYGYDASGNLTTYKNPLAVAGSQPPVSYAYFSASDGPNLNHALKSYTLPRGNGMAFEYYANGKAFRHTTFPGAETTTFAYNDFRRETVQTNPRGLERRFFFDPSGNPLKIIEENGAERVYTYDPATPMNRLSKKDPQGLLTQYQYDASGNVTRITQPSGASVDFSYFTAFNQPGKIKDARGNYTLLKYDSVGNLTQEIILKSGLGAALNPATYTPAAAEIKAWTLHGYDVSGNRITTKRVRDVATQTGPLWTTTYDAQRLNLIQLSRQGDKNGDGLISPTETDTSPSLSYDTLGRPTQGLDAAWYPTQLQYDSVDRPTRASDALGNLRDIIYDRNGNPAGQSLTVPSTPNGVPALIDQAWASFDDADRPDHTLDAAGNVTAYQYDANGNITQLTNPDNLSLAFDYDAADRWIRAYDRAGRSVQRRLDLTGQPRSVTDPNGNTLQYDYYDSSQDGRLKSTTDASGKITTYSYDAHGNVTTVTDNGGRVTLIQYDELNRPTRTVGPVYSDPTLGAIRPLTQTTYNTLGHRTQVSAGRTDSSGTNLASDIVTPQHTVQYDDFGRAIKATDPLGRTWLTQYDINHNPVQTTDAKGQTTQYTWGRGQQLLTQRDHSGQLTTVTRNPLGQPTQVGAPGVTTATVYDTAHRLQTVTDSRPGVPAKTLNYAWSPAGRLNSLTDSTPGNNAAATHYLYDPDGRLSGIWAPNYDYVSVVYDPAGRLAEKWLPNGTSARYQYNPDNTLKQLVNRSAAATVLTQHDYSYDSVGNRIKHIEKIGATTTVYDYVYDPLDRLTQVRNGTPAGQEDYAYDPLNNRTQKTVNLTAPSTLAYLYDAAHQLKEIRQTSPSGALLASLAYDLNGNLLSNIAGSTTTSLTYNALNQVTQVSKTGLATQNYQYDDQGRRIQKTVGATTTNYLYSGPDRVAEYAGGASTPAALYVHGPNWDDPLIRLTGSNPGSPSATAQYYHADGLGSIVGISTNQGTTTQTQRFDAWGNKLTGTIPQSAQYGYTGREPDETGLIYYRARYYDPTIGRFTQRDPIGLRGGINPYAYVNNNPVNFTDPTGEVLNPVGAGWGFISGGISGGITGWNAVDPSSGSWSQVTGAFIGAVSGGLAGAGVGALFRPDLASVVAIQVAGGTVGGVLGNIGSTTANQAINNQPIKPLANTNWSTTGAIVAGAGMGGAAVSATRLGGGLANSTVAAVNSVTGRAGTSALMSGPSALTGSVVSGIGSGMGEVMATPQTLPSFTVLPPPTFFGSSGICYSCNRMK